VIVDRCALEQTVMVELAIEPELYSSDLKWPLVRADVLTEMHARVNAKLLAKQIPTVSCDVFEWRLAWAIQYRPAGKQTVPGVKEHGLICIAKEKHNDGVRMEPASGSI
jgi:hypothetical protein